MRKTKDKICAKCLMREHCDDLPGFCLMLPYVAIAGIAVLLIYFIINSSL